jgi:uncharacterized protein with GYD domain
MAEYMLQLSYTAPAWEALVKKPQNRIEVVGKVVEKLGGKVKAFWLAFGEHDVVGVVEMPDNVTAAAFAIALAAGGACHHIKTTPLMGFEEGLEAMKKARTCGYKPATRK